MTDSTLVVAGPDLAAIAAVVREVEAALPGTSVELVWLTGDAGGLFPAADPTAAAADLVGVDRVRLVPVTGDPATLGPVLADALQRAVSGGEGGGAGRGVRAILLADHPATREAAARLAVRLSAPCASMVEGIGATSDGSLTVRRGAYGGIATASLELVGTPAICVMTPRGGAAPAAEGPASAASGPSGAGDATFETADAIDTDATRGLAGVSIVSDAPISRSVDLSGARRIVSVGRGFAKADDIALVEPLLQALEAELGCSRPIAEDFKWLPKERLVGLTGASVSPELYFALGISGQVQHLAGIKGARTVVAVNSDPRSPITRNADYTVIGDLYKVIPALVEALQPATAGD